jgi:hypothetical protein
MGEKDKEIKKNKAAKKSDRKLKKEKGSKTGIINRNRTWKNTPSAYLIVYRDFYESIIKMIWEYRLRIREESTLKVKGKVMQGGKGGTGGELGCVSIMGIKWIK